MESIDFTGVYETFADALTKRFAEQKKRGGDFRVAEDTIRYFFFDAAVQKGGLKASDFWLEGHFFGKEESRKNLELDALILPEDGRNPVAIEFKYDRLGENTDSGAETSSAGAIYRDLNRLASLSSPAKERLFVYVAEARMKNYFSGGNTQWGKSVETLPLEGGTTAVISAKAVRELNGKDGCGTFYNGATDDGRFAFEQDISVTRLFSQECGENEFLYIFKVEQRV